MSLNPDARTVAQWPTCNKQGGDMAGYSRKNANVRSDELNTDGPALTTLPPFQKICRCVLRR